MKKILLFSAFILMITLVGCSYKNNEETSKSVSSKTSIQEEQSTETHSIQKKDATEDNKLIELEEFDAIQSQISLADLTGTVSLNNLSKRIVIFKDYNQKEKYKAVFIKSKRMLKILDISDHNKMIFRGNI